MTDDPYVYAGTSILRNKFHILDADRLDCVERRLATERATHGILNGNFDLKHLQAIHRHLFQDIYDWAGQIRTVEISKPAASSSSSGSSRPAWPMSTAASCSATS